MLEYGILSHPREREGLHLMFPGMVHPLTADKPDTAIHGFPTAILDLGTKLDFDLEIIHGLQTVQESESLWSLF